jgi:hypothetical protein
MRYLMLIYSEESKMNAEREKVGQDGYTGQWMAYTEGFAKTGKMLGGEALHPTAAATSVRAKAGGGTMTTDGPFVETKETLGGYYIMDAANLDEAIFWAGKMPIFASGGGVEIRPIIEFN